MHTASIPRSLQSEIERRSHAIERVELTENEAEPDKGPWSVRIRLNQHWYHPESDQGSMIHQASASGAIDALRGIRPVAADYYERTFDTTSETLIIRGGLMADKIRTRTGDAPRPQYRTFWRVVEFVPGTAEHFYAETGYRRRWLDGGRDLTYQVVRVVGDDLTLKQARRHLGIE